MRITNEILNNQIEWLNRLTGNPLTPYKKERDENGRLVQNGGHYMIDSAYGGVKLSRMCENGGCSDESERVTKSELSRSLGVAIRILEREAQK